MIYPEIKLAQSIIEICKAKNIKNIVISPGSRNAPLTIGFASDPFFTCYSLADERCAAFFAMGISQQTNYPTALVCTSGSALLNYYPAVAEAFYSQIPLIVISADRPTSKIDIGDGQTIRQRDVYHNHILYNANLLEEASQENDSIINMAINMAIAKKGPVHINAPFEEPLYNTVETLEVSSKIVDLETLPPSPIEYSSYAKKWNETKRKLVLVGVNKPNSIDKEVIEFLANDPSVVVMTETTSNLHHPNFVEHIDRIITSFNQDDFKLFQPDILITFGGMVVSKRIKAFLRKYKPIEHWHIDNLRHYDTFGALTNEIFETPNNFLKNLAPLISNEQTIGYQKRAHDIVLARRARHNDYVATIAFSDLKAFECIANTLPEHTQLQISNSSAIRYAQLVPLDSSIEVFCNRGTSGIDGCTSTAIGAAIGSGKPTVIVTGDISFLYDSNALWNAYIPKNFKIILLNNKGGGIFRILPGHQETPVFNTYFETTHELTAEHLAKMFHFDYYTAQSEEELNQILPEFWQSNDKPVILEIITPTMINDKILQEYFRKM
ncbi:2-succinyl-5-enolpyruvyl-6-hydroxy-3-cyclohexene-1-carboxylic-acid synthase [Myroides injenensis]|uniref:2-succinyl-5-enolpyruvyl-6-hydroxy-3- cyclohexene-1-carboxylic-acid synthase n=1 Tax=Myroides injenensis TaxID=1183151 RepID=UPI002270F5DC|nr:2-succinyl-5-enolpyruvyl-6-hydroxy-3-cyclohexene-1-carboxylic-acid synthase [Myroides injenensis]